MMQRSKVAKLLLPHIYVVTPLITVGAILFGLMELGSLFSSRTYSALNLAAEANARVTSGDVEFKKSGVVKENMSKIFFGENVSADTVEGILDSKMRLISTRGAYSASLAVIQKHEKTIRTAAKKYGVPDDVALGVGVLENGGSETAKSPAGALGVFQLMPRTARSLGLKVTGQVDERKIPAKNIDAGIRYLALNYYRFGDWGLATWAYHAGEGNVSRAVQIYAKSTHGISLPGVNDPLPMRQYIEKYGITIHKLLSHASVKRFTKGLNDDSAGYPYKVIATATLFDQAK